ncbi:peroxiredoxin [bacterium]|nr:peroxiredoxin [bacterium]
MKAKEPVHFSGVDQNGKPINSEDFKGRWIALYFYPKDDTPGCTKQACNLRENFDELQKHGIEILGVSPDDVESHKKFEQKYDLPFRLIADPERKISKMFGVYKWHFGFNFFPYKWVKRVTVLIDPNGIEVGRIEKVEVGNHSKQILEFLKSYIS